MLALPSIKIMSHDVEKESQKVRSMYEQGSNFDWQDGRYSNRTNIGEVIAGGEPNT
jgi:hypothetical protein